MGQGAVLWKVLTPQTCRLMLGSVQGTEKEHGVDGLGGIKRDNLLCTDFHVREVGPYQGDQNPRGWTWP